jgi:hypothetical protein
MPSEARPNRIVFDELWFLISKNAHEVPFPVVERSGARSKQWRGGGSPPRRGPGSSARGHDDVGADVACFIAQGVI